MIARQTDRLSLIQLPSLALTLEMLLNKQEKNWGCFQVKQEGDFYTLYVPGVASFKLFTNPKSIGYKGYWLENFDDRLPDVKDRSAKPDIYTRRKTKQVEIKRKILKKQVIFEINYRYNSCSEINLLNQILTQLIRDRIESNLSFSPEEEIMPLVLIKSADD
ncbi:MAG: hypothetical protein Tsb0014_29260 [Pleurocapsa sp.]